MRWDELKFNSVVFDPQVKPEKKYVFVIKYLIDEFDLSTKVYLSEPHKF